MVLESFFSKVNKRIPTTSGRVPHHTADAVNRRIHLETRERLSRIGGDQERIARRLREIEREWDIERTLEANAATVSLIGLALAAGAGRRWLILPAAVAGFLLQHAIQGWCPPLPIFRRLGIRTAREIEEERAVLLARQGGVLG